MITLEDIPSIETDLKPGFVYLTYGSDQQIKVYFWKKSIPYHVLVHPTYSEVEKALNESSFSPFESKTDGLIIFPKSYRVIHNRKPKEEDIHCLPNYRKLQVSKKRIVFVVGDPYENTNDLKRFYKKLEGGVFKSLVISEKNRFPLSQLYHYSTPEEDDKDLFETLIESLFTKKGVFRWKSSSRNEFYRLFQTLDDGTCSFSRLLFSRSSYACRDLYPWILPFLYRLNKEKWQYPGEMLGRFALWVYRSGTLWSKPYEEGLKRIWSNDRDFLIFNPSYQAKQKYLCYLNDNN